MKFKTTVKAIRKNYHKNNILEIGYCDLQNLLRYETAHAYCSGVYGWNFDLYQVEGVAICTGYRGMPKGKTFNYELVRKYDNKARAIIQETKKDNETWEHHLKNKENKVTKLLHKFISEVYKEA